MNDLISRQAAIDALYKMLHDCFWADDEELDAVITTLNDLPSVQPVAKDTNVLNNDTISRAEAIDVAFDIFPDDEYFQEQFVKSIEALPSAQPEIIRCKDCKWWERSNDNIGYCHATKHCHYSTNWEISIYRRQRPDFYCADAERRTDEKTGER